MGFIIDVSPRLSVELRRDSYHLYPEPDDDDDTNIEMHYNTVFALEAAVKEIIASERFQQWLYKEEHRRA
jgi:hypothetical protein